MTDGGSQGLGLKAMTSELGCEPRLEVVHIHTDSTVAESFLATRGLGRTSHLDVKLCGGKIVCSREDPGW